MTEQQLKLIYDYMGWNIHFNGHSTDEAIRYFTDSNHAWECVQEMERKEQYVDFYDYFYDYWLMHIREDQDEEYWRWGLWSNNPDNFFNCFAKWLEAKNETK